MTSSMTAVVKPYPMSSLSHVRVTMLVVSSRRSVYFTAGLLSGTAVEGAVSAVEVFSDSSLDVVGGLHFLASTVRTSDPMKCNAKALRCA